MKAPRALLPAALLLAVAATSSCSSPGPAAGSPASTAVPHGFVEGAEENGEAQTRLTYLDSGTGEIHVIELATGKEVHHHRVEGATGLLHDGRYVFAIPGPGTRATAVDTGVWTVDHGDHRHYYAQAPSTLDGPLEAIADAAAGDGHRVAFFDDAAGTAGIVERTGLDDGDIATSMTIESTPHDGLAVPYAGHYLVSSNPDTRHKPHGIDLHDADGQHTKTLSTDCPGLTDQALTRAGVLFGCDDGALLVTEDDGEFTAEKISYPSAAGTQPAAQWHHRAGSNEVAAAAGTAGIWHLNTSNCTAQLFETPEPMITATTAGDESTVLGLGATGTLYRLDASTGKITDRKKLLGVLDPSAPPTVEIDTARAYVNDAAGHKIYEIDYQDQLRTARTIETSGQPDLLAETGL